jgi:hypothetical protein
MERRINEEAVCEGKTFEKVGISATSVNKRRKLRTKSGVAGALQFRASCTLLGCATRDANRIL